MRRLVPAAVLGLPTVATSQTTTGRDGLAVHARAVDGADPGRTFANGFAGLDVGELAGAALALKVLRTSSDEAGDSCARVFAGEGDPEVLSVDPDRADANNGPGFVFTVRFPAQEAAPVQSASPSLEARARQPSGGIRVALGSP